MSFNDVAGLPALSKPNKNDNHFEQDLLTNCISSTWDETSLLELKEKCLDELSPLAIFDKKDNVLLNGLRNYSGKFEVFCPKCKKMVKTTKNGFVKDSYQFFCCNASPQHQISASQILRTLPDEFFEDIIELLDEAQKAALLKWIEREYLCDDLWETKGSKNAMKRFSQELSPIKGDSIKIRAVNHGLEEENRKLREENAQLLVEIKEMKSIMKALTEEVTNLRKYLSEKNEPEVEKSKKEDSKLSFATITEIHRPKKTENKRRPLEIISGTRNENNSMNSRPAYSPLRLIYFKGCKRASAGEYRRMLIEIGVQSRTIRDITFLTDDILQITTYESEIVKIKEKLEGLSENVKHLDNFNPCSAESYAEYGTFTDDQVKSCYFSLMKKSAERIEKASDTLKPLKRTASFLKKLIETESTSYDSPTRRPRTFVLGDYFDLNQTKNETMSDEPENITSDIAPSAMNIDDSQ